MFHGKRASEVREGVSDGLLEIRLVGAARERPSSPEAYDLYLRAREILYERNPRQLPLADGQLDQAIRLAPDYAPLYAAKALSTILLSNGDGCYGSRPVDKALPEAKEHLDRALELAPNLAEAHTGDYRQSTEALQRMLWQSTLI